MSPKIPETKKPPSRPYSDEQLERDAKLVANIGKRAGGTVCSPEEVQNSTSRIRNITERMFGDVK